MTSIDKLCTIITKGDYPLFNTILTEIGDGKYSSGLEKLELYLDRVEDSDIVKQTIMKHLNLEAQAFAELIEKIRIKHNYYDEKGIKDRAERRAYLAYVASIPEYLPYLWVENERRIPSQIVFFGLCGGTNTHKKIFLPWDIADKKLKKQYKIIKEAMLKNRDEPRYNCWFGKVTGFIYRPDKRTNKFFDYDGNYVRKEIYEFKEPQVTIRIK